MEGEKEEEAKEEEEEKERKRMMRSVSHVRGAPCLIALLWLTGARGKQNETARKSLSQSY